jgi:ferrous-iron efflux pump FieF
VVLISISALGLAMRAIQQLTGAGRVEAAGDGILVSVIAISATLALLAWQRHVIKRTGSLAIATDHVHYKSDLLLNLAVIAALVLDRYAGFSRSDPLFGLAIALWLAWGAWKASSQAIEQLMDREWDDEKKARFVEVLGRHPELRGVHDFRTRTSGNRDFVQFHVWIDPNMTVLEAHRVMDEIETKLMSEFPGVEIFIHPDPDGLVNEKGAAGRDIMQGAAAQG